MKTNYFKILGKNTASNFVFFFVKNFLSLLTYALLIRFLDLEDYGLLIFTAAFLGQFAFLEGGLSTALEKFIPEFKVKNQLEKINESVVVTLLFFTGMGFLVSILLVLIVWFDGTSWFKVKNIAQGNTLLLYAAIFAPIAWAIKAITGGLKGFNKYHEINIIDVIFMVLNSGITITLAYLDFSIITIFLGQQIALIVKGSLLWKEFTKSFRVTFLNLNFDKLITNFKYIFSYSVWVLIMRLSGMLINQFDKIIVSSMLGVEKLPIYVGIEKLMKIILNLNAQLKKSIIPIASEIYIESNLNRVNEVGFKITKVLNAISAPLVGLIILFSEPILLLMGKDILIPYMIIFQIGLILFLIVNSKSFLQSMHIGAGKIVKILSLFTVLRAICYLVFTVAGIRLFDLNGAILSNPVTSLLLFPLWIYIVFGRANISLKSFLKSVIQGQADTWLVVIIYFVSKYVLISFRFYSLATGIVLAILLSALLLLLSWVHLDPLIRQFVKKQAKLVSQYFPIFNL